jgi:hypothetical protein
LVAINDSYQNYESQIEMLQSAMKISLTNCLRQIKIRDEAESLKEFNKNLQSILDSMSLGQGFASNKRF